MKLLSVLPCVKVHEEDLEPMEDFIASSLPLRVRRDPAVALPESTYLPQRGQYDGSALLRHALENGAADADRVLLVTELDLCIPMLTFIFGQAQLQGRAAIVSLARLRPEFDGLPPDPALTRERLCKEALHELGHTFGLTHCTDPSCAMSLSINIANIDRKNADLCRDCAILLIEHLGAADNAAGPPRSES